jgi:hypothetical protein
MNVNSNYVPFLAPTSGLRPVINRQTSILAVSSHALSHNRLRT